MEPLLWILTSEKNFVCCTNYKMTIVDDFAVVNISCRHSWWKKNKEKSDDICLVTRHLLIILLWSKLSY